MKYAFFSIPIASIPPTGGIFKMRPVNVEEMSEETRWKAYFTFASGDEYYLARAKDSGGPLVIEFEPWRCVGFGKPCSDCEHGADCPDRAEVAE